MAIFSKRALIFLLLLPAFFLLHNYNELFGFLSIVRMLKYAAILYPSLLIAYGVLRKFIHPDARVALLVFVLLLFFLFFGPSHLFLRQLFPTSALSSYRVFVPLWALVLIFFALRILAVPTISPKLISYLNVVMIFFISWELISIALNFSSLQKSANLIYPQKNLCIQYVSKKIPDSTKPDIYFLVFDEYTNNDMLSQLWHINNEGITNWLSAHDFYIPSHSKANYTFTPYSISSTFNMDFIDPKKGSDATVAKNILQANQSLSDNETFCILEKENYLLRFVAPFNNRIEENGLGHYFDYLKDDQLYRQTLIGSLDADISWNFKVGKWTAPKDSLAEYNKQKAVYLTSLNAIRQVEATADNQKSRRPQFVYGHFLILHEPHVFDSNGNFRPQPIGRDAPMFKTYPMEVLFANKVIQELISYIFQNNRKNTIIIIEGDHGFRKLPPALVRCSFPNFSAIYFPDKNYDRLYSDLSPINTFRIVFNQYFDQNFPLLKDSSTLVKEY
jgi:hypothetical protein